MALDPARVIKPHPIPEELLCCICTGVLRNPVEGPCEHLACRECLDGWLQRSESKTCPTCRQPLAEGAIKPGHRAVRSQLDAFEVTCDNATRGCTAVITLGVLPGHLSSCGKGIERCSNSGCVATVLREDLAKHLQACPHRIVSCRRCDAKIKHQHEQTHLQDKCPGVEVRCQLNGGCGKAVRRDAMATHVDTECSRAIVTCEFPGCQRQMARGAMKEHLDSSQVEHMTSLVSHVASLSLELQQAKSKIADQGAELARLKAPPLGAFHCTATLHEDSKPICTLAAADGLLYSTTDDEKSGIRVWKLNDQTRKKSLEVKPSSPEFEGLWTKRSMVEGGVLHTISRKGVITWTPPDYQPKFLWKPYDDLEDAVISQGKIYGALTEKHGNCHRVVELSRSVDNSGTPIWCDKTVHHNEYGEVISTIALDGALLYAASLHGYGRSVKVLDTTTMEVVRVLHEQDFDKNEWYLALGDSIIYGVKRNQHLIQAWSTVDHTHVADIWAPMCHLVAAGGGFLFAAAGYCHIKVWSTKDYSRPVTELTGHQAPITALLVHNGMLFSGSKDGQIKIWRIPTC
eukprot:jgi/Mesvir1/12308/Mv00506-RA.1